MTNSPNIAIVRLGALGDIIHGLPLIYVLKEHMPGCKITWIAEQKWGKIFPMVRGVDRLILLDRQRAKKEGLRYLKTFYKTIRAEEFDIVINIQGLIKSGLVTKLTNAPVTIGFSAAYCKEGISAFLAKTRVTPDKDLKHVIDQNLALLSPLGIKVKEWKFPIATPPEAEEKIDAFFKQMNITKSDILVGINLSAGWETKKWPAERFSELGNSVVERFGAKILIVWGPSEEGEAAKISRGINKNAIVAPQTSVPELAALLGRLKLLISSDTGPLHIASAVGTPTVALFGPTDPRRNGAYGENHRVLIHSRDCGNCYKRTCKKNPCMLDITSNAVFKVSCEVLNTD